MVTYWTLVASCSIWSVLSMHRWFLFMFELDSICIDHSEIVNNFAQGETIERICLQHHWYISIYLDRQVHFRLIGVRIELRVRIVCQTNCNLFEIQTKRGSIYSFKRNKLEQYTGRIESLDQMLTKFYAVRACVYDYMVSCENIIRILILFRTVISQFWSIIVRNMSENLNFDFMNFWLRFGITLQAPVTHAHSISTYNSWSMKHFSYLLDLKTWIERPLFTLMLILRSMKR